MRSNSRPMAAGAAVAAARAVAGPAVVGPAATAVAQAAAMAAKVVAKGSLPHQAMVARVNLHRLATAKVSRHRRDPTATKASLRHRGKTSPRDNLRNRANPRRPVAARVSRLREAPTAARANLHHRRQTNRLNRANLHPVAGSSRLRRETMLGRGNHRPPLEANRNNHLRANSARSPRLPRRARANCRPTHNRRPAGLTAPPTGNLMTQLAFRLPQAR